MTPCLLELVAAVGALEAASWPVRFVVLPVVQTQKTTQDKDLILTEAIGYRYPRVTIVKINSLRGLGSTDHIPVGN